MPLVYITQHSIDGVNEIISVSLDFKRATTIFNLYVDALETTWRLNEPMGKSNTFNRFSEPVDEYLISANVQRDDSTHNVYLVQFASE